MQVWVVTETHADGHTDCWVHRTQEGLREVFPKQLNCEVDWNKPLYFQQIDFTGDGKYKQVSHYYKWTYFYQIHERTLLS